MVGRQVAAEVIGDLERVYQRTKAAGATDVHRCGRPVLEEGLAADAIAERLEGGAAGA
jgi:hypothetical protein